ADPQGELQKPPEPDVARNCRANRLQYHGEADASLHVSPSRLPCHSRALRLHLCLGGGLTPITVGAQPLTGTDTVTGITVPVGLGTLHGHSSWVEGVAFSPDGEWLVSGSLDGTVKVWKTLPAQESTVVAEQ